MSKKMLKNRLRKISKTKTPANQPLVVLHYWRPEGDPPCNGRKIKLVPTQERPTFE